LIASSTLPGPRIGLRRRFGLVLILLQVHLELVELAQVAAGTAAAAAAALLEGDLHVRERRLGAQEMLQRVLLRRHGLLELHVAEIVGCRLHRVCGVLEVLHELLDFLVDARELASARARRERARLIGERAL
jgi:hypothetical protein